MTHAPARLRSVCCPYRYHFVPYGHNFGDVVGGAMVRYASAPAQLGRFERDRARGHGHGRGGCASSPIIVALGSVLHHPFPRTSILWGTGHLGNPTVWDPVQFRTANKRFDVRATRGTLTLQFIRESWPRSKTQGAALGDPALLLPLAYSQCRRLCEPVREVCVIPHWEDRDDPALMNLSNAWSVRHVQTPWEEMLVWILGCRLVLSSSLHGIIFAEAFGVPARWVRRKGSQGTESWFKYVDYYSAVRPDLALAYSSVQVSFLSNTTKVFPVEPVVPLASFGVQPASSWEEGFTLGGAPGIDGFDVAPLLRSFPRETLHACPKQDHMLFKQNNSRWPKQYLIGGDLPCIAQSPHALRHCQETLSFGRRNGTTRGE